MHVFSAFISFVLFGSMAQASPYTCGSLFRDSRLVSERNLEVPSIEKGTGFVIPNENTIARAKNDFAAAASGLYVSVGTERSLMGAILTQGRATAIVIADVDPRVVVFSRVNKALLELAGSREEYLEMRLRSSFLDIQARLARHGTGLTIDNLDVLTNREIWTWWRATLDTNTQWAEFHDKSSSGFKGANYLFEDAAFARVSALAKRDRIIVIRANLGSPEFQSRVLSISDRLNQKISILDLSNAWQEGYLGHDRTVSLISAIDRVLTPASKVIFTYQSADVTTVGHPTVFNFWFIARGAGPQIGSLTLSMSTMERMEPSRRDHQNPRAARYNRFDRTNEYDF